MDSEASAKPRSGPSLRIIALVMALVLTLLIGWYVLVLRQNYALLYSDLRPREAAAVVEALEKQGVPYRLGEGGAEIRVPASRLDEARLDLASSDAPLGGLDGFELFNESDMGLTDFAQKIRYQRALQGELARTIMMMEGVADARVHISMPERTLFRGERRNAEAAVTLVMRTPEHETPARIEGVQRLVAASVPDLLISDVVVLNARGEVISPRVEVDDAFGSERQGLSTDVDAPSIEFVMTVMRAALPNRQFEISIEPAASLDGAENALRAPQRVVTVMTDGALSGADMERVSAALRNSGVVDGVSGGTLVFRRAAPAINGQETASASQEPSAAAAAPNLLAATLPWAGLALLALLGLFAWRWWRKPRLDANEHERFADRLKAALDAEQGESQRV